MEGQVTLVLSGDGMGNVTVQAALLDVPGSDNRLQSEFVIDQTYRPGLLSTWPVLGQP